jgi:hypothetical protein
MQVAPSVLLLTDPVGPAEGGKSGVTMERDYTCLACSEPFKVMNES